MKRFFWISSSVAALIIMGSVVFVHGSSNENHAGSDNTIPSYYSHLDFNLTSPGALATSIGGFANPAVYQMMPGSELRFCWSDEGARLRSIPKWGLFFGSTHIGFGAVHTRFNSPLTLGTASVTDYRFALSMGNKNAALGLGYGWSSGDEELAGRSRMIQLGTVHRYNRYASLGLVGAFSVDKDVRSGIFDFAVRPLGNRRLTVFADAEMQKDTRLDDALWSVGALLEPLPGLQLTGRYFKNESYAFSVGFSVGFMSTTASPRVNKDNELDRTLYQVRLGYDERNVIDTYFNRGSAYLKMELTGNVRYRRHRFLDAKKHSLKGILSALEAVRNDPRVNGVALNLSGAKISMGKAWEIGEKLNEIKKEGKHVVIYIDEAGMTLYHLASVADRIVLDPTGMLTLPGYLAGRTFVVNLLAKLGLGIEEWRFFKYKSAFEMFSRDKMSDPDKEQRLALIKGFFEEIKTDVTAARGVSDEEFNRWINEEMVFTPRTALSEGLVDKLGKWEDVKDVIEELEGSKKRYIGPSKLADYAFPSTLWGENPKVAVVYGLGMCAMEEGIKARKLEKVFKKLEEDHRVKAVVFRVDSPGGSAMASDVVAEALRKCKERKPVIVSQGDVAASGGYWISMYGTEILALPTTVTGSIGVIGGWLWNDGIGEKMGLTSDYVKVGEHADLGFGILGEFFGAGIPDRNLNEEERDKVEEIFLEVYDDFLVKVAEGRQMEKDAVAEIAQGRVWTGHAGKANGLVDRIGGLELALRIAKEQAGIDPGETVDVDEYPLMPLINWDALFGGRGGVLSLFLSNDEKRDCYESEDEDFGKDYDLLYLRALADNKGRPLCIVPPEMLPRNGGLFGE